MLIKYHPLAQRGSETSPKDIWSTTWPQPTPRTGGLVSTEDGHSTTKSDRSD